MTAAPHEILWTTAGSAFVARSLHAVADLGLADHIADDPVPVDTLAAACAVDPDGLRRVLDLLAAHGIFARRGDTCAHTPASDLLRSDHPMSMRDFARMMGLPSVWQSAGELAHSVRTGAPAVDTFDPKGFWAYLIDHPEELEVFGRAMTAKAAADVAALLATYDFGRFASIADVGGGRGHLLRTVLDAVPAAHGVLFDLPEVIDGVTVAGDRLTTQAGDFFVDPLPAADAYVLMEVIHDWADDEAVAILGAVRRAAPSGATVLVVEGVLDDEPSAAEPPMLDVIMLTVTGGRERNGRELAELFERAGLRAGPVVATPGRIRIAEATAP